MKSRKRVFLQCQKKEESLLGKIKLMIGERIDILNNDFFNQKLESLNRRVEQVQCKKTHEEIAKTFLKKVSKLERRINAAIAFQDEAFSKIAFDQTMLPSAVYQNTVLNPLGPSSFSTDTINIPTSSSNTLLPSPHTVFTSAHVSEYIRVSRRKKKRAGICVLATITKCGLDSRVSFGEIFYILMKSYWSPWKNKIQQLQIIQLFQIIKCLHKPKYQQQFRISSNFHFFLHCQGSLFIQSLLKNSKTLFRIPKLKVPDEQNPNGTALSLTIAEIDAKCASLHRYHLYLFYENLSNNSASPWKKIGKIRALPLSVACCLSQGIIPKEFRVKALFVLQTVLISLCFLFVTVCYELYSVNFVSLFLQP